MLASAPSIHLSGPVSERKLSGNKYFFYRFISPLMCLTGSDMTELHKTVPACALTF